MEDAPVRFIYPTAHGYSHAVQVDLGPTTMLLLSGQLALPLDMQGEVVGRGDVGQQTEQIFANLQQLLTAAGGTLRHLVKLTVYLTDITQRPAMSAVRARFIDAAAPPASTVVEVSRLFHDDFLIEIEATAIIPKK